jgi:hypothetical protein
MGRIALLIAAAFVALCGLAAAQDGGARGGLYKQVLDNERIRVFEANFKPGDKLPPRNYPNHLMVMLTDGTLVFAPAGRTAYEISFKAGETMWFPPLARGTENDSDKEVRLLVVEFKEGTVGRAAKAKSKGKGKAKARALARHRAKGATKK